MSALSSPNPQGTRERWLAFQTSGLSLLLILVLAQEDFPQGLSSKTNISKFLFDLESVPYCKATEMYNLLSLGIHCEQCKTALCMDKTWSICYLLFFILPLMNHTKTKENKCTSNLWSMEGFIAFRSCILLNSPIL